MTTIYRISRWVRDIEKRHHLSLSQREVIFNADKEDPESFISRNPIPPRHIRFEYLCEFDYDTKEETEQSLDRFNRIFSTLEERFSTSKFLIVRIIYPTKATDPYRRECEMGDTCDIRTCIGKSNCKII